MKGCRKSGALLTAILLTSFFMSSGCGIPVFLNLDREISVSGTTATDGSEIQVSVSISPEGIAKFSEYGITNGPSLKFFYVISPNPSSSAPISSENSVNSGYYYMNYVTSQFNANFKGTKNNGVPWSPESPTGSAEPSAPGFYLYSKSDGTSHRNFARRSSQIIDRAADASGILVGTFAHHEGANPGLIPDDHEFGMAPAMDLLLPATATYNFSLKRDAIGTGQVIVLDDGSVDKLYLTSFRRNMFPMDGSSSGMTNYLLEDGYFHRPIYDEIVTGYSSTLYLHIWAAVYAGDGSFTNIYWSDLKRLGTIRLF
ncbi:MAG: hypothetical protein RBT44_08610 [Sphaerochaetaceae bacterium]|jgi:hypothetical protein|nr:hypothetical protein [Sphaerochaetaceae bacterium]